MDKLIEDRANFCIECIESNIALVIRFHNETTVLPGKIGREMKYIIS